MLIAVAVLHCGCMEDSEQRKKRLKEMRSQADQAEVSGGIEGSGVPGCTGIFPTSKFWWFSNGAIFITTSSIFSFKKSIRCCEDHESSIW
ncbi:uncharacterized protein LOC133313252 isoform X3 [Gastrolobium bilobum]|uniref:uncharacterized protein LOC133313252 isoform X3 n=1 Tax=Gastrolobium bilobum TaxID=150636 RepID=UPI002AB15675|nr:uncharacterized protein LOC133313252 isoform X3 [Gastrolobium bilobum]